MNRLCEVCKGPCKAEAPHRAGHVRQTITHNCDGPLTPFVLISRATELDYVLVPARRLVIGFRPEDVANGLHEELIARGWLVADEDAVIDGSDS